MKTLPPRHGWSSSVPARPAQHCGVQREGTAECHRVPPAAAAASAGRSHPADARATGPETERRRLVPGTVAGRKRRGGGHAAPAASAAVVSRSRVLTAQRPCHGARPTAHARFPCGGRRQGLCGCSTHPLRRWRPLQQHQLAQQKRLQRKRQRQRQQRACAGWRGAAAWRPGSPAWARPSGPPPRLHTGRGRETGGAAAPAPPPALLRLALATGAAHQPLGRRSLRGTGSRSSGRAAGSHVPGRTPA